MDDGSSSDVESSASVGYDADGVGTMPFRVVAAVATASTATGFSEVASSVVIDGGGG